MSRITRRQYEKLLWEWEKTGKVEITAMKAGIDRKTARKYLNGGTYPEVPAERNWRTREDPFSEDWAEIERELERDPGLEAVTLFGLVSERNPGRYAPGQLRTLQRRIRAWKSQHGPEKEIWFPQKHRPGEILETDWTDMNRLEIRISGEFFPHKLCHSVLTYSNWEGVSLCRTESLLSLRCQLKKFIGELGKIPRYHRTDHSSTATHALRRGLSARDFNAGYLDLMSAFGMTPTVIERAKPQENGDIESANGHIKRRIDQELRLRGDRDFGTRAEYEAFLGEIVRKTNLSRRERLEEELRTMRPCDAARISGYEEITARVTRNGIIRVRGRVYSVPSRLVGETILARLTEDTVEVWCGGILQTRRDRNGADDGPEGLDYRDIIGNLVKKPGAFRNYRYREALFPNAAFTAFYERLRREHPEDRADRIYLAVLNRAACEGEENILAALELLENDTPFSLGALEDLLASRTQTYPDLEDYRPDPGEYDILVDAACFCEAQA